MFQIFVLVLNLSTLQPAGMFKSNTIWMSKDACEAEIPAQREVLNNKLEGTIKGGFFLMMKCMADGVAI